MYQKLSSDAYTYAITQKDGVHIALQQTSTGKVKEFFIAVANPTSVEEHMNSLTDDLCSQWFNERVKKGKKSKCAMKS